MDTFSKRIVVTALVTSASLGVLAVARSAAAQTLLTQSVSYQTSSIGPAVRSASNQSVNWLLAAVGAQLTNQVVFIPQPNPEPVGTGGTGTR